MHHARRKPIFTISYPKPPQAFVLVVALWLLSAFVVPPLSAQEGTNSKETIGRMMFYNVENLFDTIDDPLTDDDAFTPEGIYHWTEGRYRRKCEHLAWVISNVGEWGFPSLIGMVEVENSDVIRDLVKHPTLSSVTYDYVVTNGSDPRGVDVALLWDQKRFAYIEAHEIPHYGATDCFPLGQDPRTPSEADGSGRNTLWVTLEHRATERKLELFVMHNPSRRGGVRATSRKRERVNAKVRKLIDHLLEEDPSRYVVVMGDFNDNPSDPSMRRALRAGGIEHNTQPKQRFLYNLAYPLYNGGKGTHRFGKEVWLPDQIIVSGGLFLGEEPLLRERRQQIFSHPELLTKDGKHLHRTYLGTHYTGGYSDHLPIYIDLY